MPSPRSKPLGAALAAAVLGAVAALPALSGPAHASDRAASVTAAGAAKPVNPCLNPVRRAGLYCPDLVMKAPIGLSLDRRVKRGRVVLRAGNSIDNIGLGPAELHGTRIGRRYMKGRQRIHRRNGTRLGIDTGARLFFKFVPGQRRYWKFERAADFTLWRLDSGGRRLRLVRRGPKVSYCLRDLFHSRPDRRRSPDQYVYPACSTDAGERKVTIGTSAGWSDVYPPGYPEQWIDVTGLRGCFSYQHTADPANGVYESNEDNNSASVTVRLPFKPGRQRCSGGGTTSPGDGDNTDPYRY